MLYFALEIIIGAFGKNQKYLPLYIDHTLTLKLISQSIMLFDFLYFGTLIMCT